MSVRLQKLEVLDNRVISCVSMYKRYSRAKSNVSMRCWNMTRQWQYNVDYARVSLYKGTEIGYIPCSAVYLFSSTAEAASPYKNK